MRIEAKPRYINVLAGSSSAQAYVPGSLQGFKFSILVGSKAYYDAHTALGRLDAITTVLPNPGLFLYMYVRKEALLSSQIEGTQSSLSDLLLHEADEIPGVPIDDVEEVSNYVKAMNYGLRAIKEDNRPVTNRLLKEVHGQLLSGGRGANKDPGNFRRIQNWLGGTSLDDAVFIPPPPNYVEDCMCDLEKFLNYDEVPVLVKAAVAHVQFETIHPFLDGNGRLGRLLVPLLLCSDGTLHQPILYLSLWLKTHRNRYYELLQSTRITGDWSEWMRFFLMGVTQTAQSAVETANNINTLIANDEQRLKSDKGSAVAESVLRAMQGQPIATASHLAKVVGRSYNAVKKALEILIQLDLVRTNNKKYNQLYIYHGMIHILSAGAEPLD